MREEAKDSVAALSVVDKKIYDVRHEEETSRNNVIPQLQNNPKRLRHNYKRGNLGWLNSSQRSKTMIDQRPTFGVRGAQLFSQSDSTGTELQRPQGLVLNRSNTWSNDQALRHSRSIDPPTLTSEGSSSEGELWPQRKLNDSLRKRNMYQYRSTYDLDFGVTGTKMFKPIRKDRVGHVQKRVKINPCATSKYDARLEHGIVFVHGLMRML